MIGWYSLSQPKQASLEAGMKNGVYYGATSAIILQYFASFFLSQIFYDYGSFAEIQSSLSTKLR